MIYKLGKGGRGTPPNLGGRLICQAGPSDERRTRARVRERERDAIGRDCVALLFVVAIETGSILSLGMKRALCHFVLGSASS